MKINLVTKIISYDISSSAINLSDEINIEKSLLKKLNANCNSAISLRAIQDGLLKGEIYGKKNYISFRWDTKLMGRYKDIKENRGIKLLNEHH